MTPAEPMVSADDTGSAGAYELLAIRYGTRQSRRSEVFHRFEIYGEPDGPIAMDYFFWLLRGADGSSVLIDCGYRPEVGSRLGRTLIVEPETALADLGVDPETVGTVILTHLHYDHVGNVGLFERAMLAVDFEDFSFWTGPEARQPLFEHLRDDAALEQLGRAVRRDRVRFLASDENVLPGVRAIRVGGHSPGQLVLLIDTRDGPVVLASDAVHYVEELVRERPFAEFTDLRGMYRAYAAVRSLSDGGRIPVVPGHDPQVATRNPSVPGCGYAIRIAPDLTGGTP